MIPTKKLTEGATIPTYGSDGAIGADLYADLTNADDVIADGENVGVVIASGARKLIKTGIAVALPPTLYGRIAPRSGLAYKHGIDVLAGVIDCDYRGDIGVILLNTGDKPFLVSHGDRIAQFILEHASTRTFKEMQSLPDTVRGTSGWGSTGV